MDNGVAQNGALPPLALAQGSPGGANNPCPQTTTTGLDDLWAEKGADHSRPTFVQTLLGNAL
eukprot:10330026-Lingulodinium_polyedra.AAC.1